MGSDEKLALVTFMLIGCDQYDNLQNLSNVKDDLSRVKEIFFKSEYSIYPEKSLREIYNRPSNDLRKAIQEYVFSRSADHDILFLFFAGHGTTIGRDDFGFCMQDAVLHPEDGVVLPTSVVKLSEIVGSLNVKNISLILFIDACYSGHASKQLAVSIPEITLEMGKLLVASSGSDFGFVSSCSYLEQIGDIGVLSKALTDICNQGIEGSNPFLSFGVLPETLTERIGTHSRGDTRPKVLIPGGTISNLPLCRNVQYFEPVDPVNIYSFTQPYFHLLEVLWNGGSPIALKPNEILEKTGSQSAYANHNKLSFRNWELVKDNRQKKRELTPRGIQFLRGEIQIPKTIVENKRTREITPAEGCPLLMIQEEKNLFDEINKVIKEIQQ